MNPAAPAQAADRNLLFGVLALQMNFIGRDDLVAAMHAWVLDKHKPLGQILREQGRLTPGQLLALDAVLAQHLLAHGDDPQRSLRALPGAETARPLLAPVRDDELELSLSSLSPTESGGLTSDYTGAARAACHYRVLRPHARGGLGEVFVAEDTELHREVALKEIRRERADDPDSRARFVLEAEVTGGLEHPGVVPVYGLGTYPDGRPYYAMRFIKGDSLRDAINRFHAAEKPGRDAGARRLELRQLLRRFVDVCNAVAYAHSRGVLHRDLKPSNVMLGKFGETLVVDWGLAKAGLGSRDHGPAGGAPEPSLRPSSGSDVLATQEGAAVGTPAYMSPEQAAGRLGELGPASDIYGLGATLYSLLTGRRAFEGPDMGTVLAEVRAGRFPPPRQVKPEVPPALDAVCRKAMALRPADRYATALDLAADVEHWLADEPVRAYPEPWPARAARWARRHRTAVVAAGVLLVTAVAALSVATGLVWREQRNTAEQKQRAEQNYQLARDLSIGSVTLIESADAQFAASPALQAQRNEVLIAAARAFRLYLEEQPADVGLRRRAARVYRYAGNARRVANEVAAAEPLYRDSLRVYEGLVEQFPNEPAYREDLSRALRDYAHLQTRTGRLRESADTLRRALAAVAALRSGGADRQDWRRDEALAFLDLAGVEYERGSAAESGRTAGGAAESFRGLIGLPVGESRPLDPLFLAAALNRVAVAEREAGRLDRAQEAHREATRLLDDLAGKRPDAVNYADILHHRAQCRLEQCRTWAKIPARRAGAEKNLAALVAQWQRLAKNYPRVPMYREWLAVAHAARGRLRAEGPRPPEAGPDFDRARELQEALVKEFPEVPNYRGQLGKTYADLGRLARATGDEPGAADWLRKATDALARAVEQSPDDAQFRRALAEARAEQAK
jgi:serine/threonine-protein kinase